MRKVGDGLRNTTFRSIDLRHLIPKEEEDSDGLDIDSDISSEEMTLDYKGSDIVVSYH